MANPAPMELISITECNRGPIKAFVTVRIGGVIIHDGKIFQRDGETTYLPPDREFTGRDGTKKYKRIVDFSDGLRQRVIDFIVAEWQRQSKGDDGMPF